VQDAETDVFIQSSHVKIRQTHLFNTATHRFLLKENFSMILNSEVIF
jgi:hypothetical protein